MSIKNFEGWNKPKKILVILAHPDDPEFFCGAAIARWCESGHEVSYCLLTKGQRGTSNPELDPDIVAGVRMGEQLNAASFLGVKHVRFLGHMDGELVSNLELREEIINEIRRVRPEIVVTCDPTNYYPGPNRINHPDHRAAGQAVLDAVFPAAGNPGYRVETADTILPAHQVEEVWLSLTHQPDFSIILTDYFEKKIEAILFHHSQVALSKEEMRERYQSRFEPEHETGDLVFYEKFKRIQFNP